jgi:endogenous inhibitor of DNA gyrase (YacG/DUF329 family)
LHCPHCGKSVLESWFVADKHTREPGQKKCKCPNCGRTIRLKDIKEAR